MQSSRLVRGSPNGRTFSHRRFDERTTLGALDTRSNPAYVGLPWTVSEPALVVHRLCVDPMAEKRGVARALMDFAERRARDLGMLSVRLDVYPTNTRAVRLYERRGYRYVGDVQFAGRELKARCYEVILREPKG